MAEKWADYLISQVQYDVEETHIVKVLSHIDSGDSIGPGTEVRRQTVVDRIEGRSTYMTITKNADGKYQKGAAVRVITVDGTKYIKTVPDNTKKDNLGSLPRF